MKNNSGSPARFSLVLRLTALPLSNRLPQSTLAVLLLFVGFACFTSAQSVNTNIVAVTYNGFTTENNTTYAVERRVFDLVNNERIKNGRRPLVWIDQAAVAARDHSENMAEFGYFSHTDLQGKQIANKADKYGLSDWREIGENIAWLSGAADPATSVVESWMNSTGHRENILNSRFRESGIGLSKTKNGKYYFTQVFVLRK